MPHIHEKIDFTVEVFIIFKNRILLRKHDKYSKWLSVGGHIELNEDPNEAALREVKEEVGLDIELVGTKGKYDEDRAVYFELVPPRFLGRNRVNEDHEHVVMVYFARAKHDNVKAGRKEDEGAECKWFTKEEVEKTDLIADIKFYALKALEELETK